MGVKKPASTTVAERSAGLPCDSDRAAVAGPGRPRILVMDDDEMVLEIAGAILAHCGCDATGERRGEEAIERFLRARAEGRPFDAVILDLMIIGGMGGEETIRRLREIDPEVRAIISSGCIHSPVMTDFRRHGFAAALPKPYTAKEFGVLIRRVLADRDGVHPDTAAGEPGRPDRR